MSKDRKITLSWFLAWNYDYEEERLNKYSESGWRLIKAHTFYKEYEKDVKKFKYRIDYNNLLRLSEEEGKRYIDTFAEQGWRFVTDVSGWNYFEKEIKADDKEEDYEIYTDNASLRAALKHWILGARVLQLVCLCTLIMNLYYLVNSQPYNMFALVISGIEVALFEFGVLTMKRKRVGAQKSKGLNVVAGNIMFIGMIVWIVATIASADF